MPSASAMQPSLADWMMTPCSRSSTFTRLWIAAYIVEPLDIAPPLRQAFSLMTKSSVSLMLPSSSCSNATSRVISLARLAGATSASALFSNSTEPVSASIRMACGAEVCGGAALEGAQGAAQRPAAASIIRQNRRMPHSRCRKT